MDGGSAKNFTRLGTIGIEEEFYLVDDAGEPVAGTDKLVYENEPPEILKGRIDHELFKFVIETQTPIIPDIGSAETSLIAIRNALLDYAAEHGFSVAGAGLHPTARWRELEHADKPRYRSQLDRIQYPQHRNITAGLHIHIGVDDANKAVWVANEIRWYLPILLSLSANSPFWYGSDTGLASARAKQFENLPNTGMPTAFESYDAFDSFEATMVRTDSIADRGELWFDVRPHSALGTVEVRTPDSQAEPWRVLAMVEYVHALVQDLAAAYEDGTAGTAIRRELLDENKWRAIRHGRDASFILPDGSATVELQEIVHAEADRLSIDGIRELLAAEDGATRQRRIAETKGIEAVPATLRLTKA